MKLFEFIVTFTGCVVVAAESKESAAHTLRQIDLSTVLAEVECLEIVNRELFDVRETKHVDKTDLIEVAHFIAAPQKAMEGGEKQQATGQNRHAG